MCWKLSILHLQCSSLSNSSSITSVICSPTPLQFIKNFCLMEMSRMNANARNKQVIKIGKTTKFIKTNKSWKLDLGCPKNPYTMANQHVLLMTSFSSNWHVIGPNLSSEPKLIVFWVCPCALVSPTPLQLLLPSVLQLLFNLLIKFTLRTC